MDNRGYSGYRETDGQKVQVNRSILFHTSILISKIRGLVFAPYYKAVRGVAQSGSLTLTDDLKISMITKL